MNDHIIIEPASVYNENRKEYLTSHALADFRRCPRLYRDKQLGLISDRDSAAYAFGRAAHVRILEGRERYENEFAEGGPINPKTGQPFGNTTKAFAEWAATVGKPVVSDADAATISQMNASVQSHTEARELLSKGLPEGVIRANHCGVMCQIRMDWFCPERRLIADLKTCANIERFEDDAIEYGYIEQAAFYREIMADANHYECEMYLIAIEKRAPYRCGVWMIDRGELDKAARQIIDNIEDLKACTVADEWPTRFESIRVLKKGTDNEFAE